MKELRVLLGIYITMIVVLIACTKHVDVVTPETIDFGKQSTGMSFTSFPITSNGTVTFSVQVTPGSKYSIQVINISGDIKVKQGLLAKDTIEKITVPLNQIGTGIYDVVVMDIQGNEIKQPIIKKL
jgi:hypothetical protein